MSGVLKYHFKSKYTQVKYERKNCRKSLKTTDNLKYHEKSEHALKWVDILENTPELKE